MDSGLDNRRAAVRLGLGISEQLSRARGIHLGRRKIRMGTAKSPFQTLIERAASSYIAGPTIASARLVCERLASSGIASTVCYWNRPSDSPLHTTERYLGLLDLIQDLPAGSYLSVKAPALGFDMKLIEQVLDEAHRSNTTVHFDAMSPETA